MKTKNQSLLTWFRGSFFVGIAFSVLAVGIMILEVMNDGNWYVESLVGLLGMGLLCLYFSGKPMVDERIRFLKFKALSIAFVITVIAGMIINYIVTYPDGHQDNAVSSYWFALACLLVAFVSFTILKHNE